ncbi:MAG: xylose isomerase [Planctomycetes bacterium GWF2_50_10]|nr:MAG: xylose isomerase [Planctomycetes bacterium GWF2_50_10]
MAGVFRFSFGPWNINEGADPFGPSVRKPVEFGKKLATYKKLGFDGVQFHDDDAVPKMNELSAKQIIDEARTLKKTLDSEGLVVEFVAPRLWEDPRTIDGGYTNNDPKCRDYAIERSKTAIDIADALGTNLIVLWLAREGTYIRESKDSKVAVDRLADAISTILKYNSNIRVAIEAKPNEPMDHTYIPTIGHAIGLGLLTCDTTRVGCVIESAHAILAGLDPSDEMGYALAHKKLWSVHLNDQNGLKFDQDKPFGSVDLRRAFNQVKLLDMYDYGKNGEWVGLDVKTMRTQKDDAATKHLSNSRMIFLKLLELCRNLDQNVISDAISNRDYEELDYYIIRQLMGKL